MRETCCKPFQSHVKTGFIKKDYTHGYWITQISSPDAEDKNSGVVIALLNCPFCGRNLI